MKRTEPVLIVAIVALGGIAIGILVEGADTRLLWYIAGIIGLIAGVPLAIPKVARVIRQKRGK